jgi:hypothetical protein
VGERVPDEGIALAIAPPACREEQVVRPKVSHHGQGRARLGKEAEDQPHGRLDLLIRIKDHTAQRIVHQPHRRPEAQRALLSLGQLATQQAAAQPVQLRLTHGAL